MTDNKIAELAEILKKKRLTSDERNRVTEALVAKYRGGASLRDLAEETGRSYSTIHRWVVVISEEPMRRNGFVGGARWGTDRPRVVAKNPEERAVARDRVRSSRAEIVDKYRSGTPMRALAGEYGVSIEFLVLRFGEWNEPIRDRAQAAAVLRRARKEAIRKIVAGH